MLQDLRNKIQELDVLMLRLLGQRFALVKQVKAFKSQAQIKIEDKDREAELLQQYRNLAVEQGLDPKLVEELFTCIFEASKKEQAS
jgi:chorismate mutase